MYCICRNCHVESLAKNKVPAGVVNSGLGIAISTVISNVRSLNAIAVAPSNSRALIVNEVVSVLAVSTGVPDSKPDADRVIAPGGNWPLSKL